MLQRQVCEELLHVSGLAVLLVLGIGSHDVAADSTKEVQIEADESQALCFVLVRVLLEKASEIEAGRADAAGVDVAVLIGLLQGLLEVGTRWICTASSKQVVHRGWW